MVYPSLSSVWRRLCRVVDVFVDVRCHQLRDYLDIRWDRTSKPATFSTSKCVGCFPIATSSGKTVSMRWMKDFALGSLAPLASGFKTV